eukprot:2331438-Pleurochrysis_carterae.AAC.1
MSICQSHRRRTPTATARTMSMVGGALQHVSRIAVARKTEGAVTPRQCRSSRSAPSHSSLSSTAERIAVNSETQLVTRAITAITGGPSPMRRLSSISASLTTTKSTPASPSAA